jgi:beta-glucosidase
VKKYFDVVDTPAEADFAICLIEEPSTGFGFSYDDVKKGGNGYLPFSLQYDDYTATFARAVSVAGGDPMEKTVEPVSLDLVRKYFDVVDSPEQADFALCLIEEPSTGFGFSYDDVKRGGNGYLPFSLQYDDYTAREARAVSVAGGDPMEKTVNRSFRGKTVKAYNRDDMLLVAATKQAMGQKPVVVILETGRPVVLAEIEPHADAILLSFSVQHQALLDIISGKAEPSALLPMQMPADMATVEQQLEDVPRDMRCYQDADGHSYDFAFGLNWSGVIDDARVKKYK